MQQQSLSQLDHAFVAMHSAFANNGAKGGIDMATQDAAWLYQHTSLGDTVLVY